MPTTYAHDLFGKEVYKRLPSDMKALIRRHGDLYRIGLHGPDILFYYMVSKNPVTQFGIEMHHEKARAFFEEGMRQVRRNNDEALFAYLLGFGCHYILDSACHPYVNKMAAEGVIPHIVLEKEFDRVLMEEEVLCLIDMYSNWLKSGKMEKGMARRTTPEQRKRAACGFDQTDA